MFQRTFFILMCLNLYLTLCNNYIYGGPIAQCRQIQFSIRQTLLTTHVKNIFIAQAERPAMSVEINIAQLTPFQRALIVTDGTVTRLIEAYTLAPVEVVLLHQAEQTLCIRAYLARSAIRGTPVICARSATTNALNRQRTRRKFRRMPHLSLYHNTCQKAFWTNWNQILRDWEEFCKTADWKPAVNCCGAAVKPHGILPQTDIAHLEEEPLLSRTYRVLANTKPIMLITEKFPLREEAH